MTEDTKDFAQNTEKPYSNIYQVENLQPSALALHSYTFPDSTPQLQHHISQQASMLEQGIEILDIVNPSYYKSLITSSAH